MKIKLHQRHRRRHYTLALLALWAGVARGWELVQQEEPRWMRFNLSQGYLKTDVEADRETATSAHSGFQTTYQRVYLAMGVGIGGSGSIYHPELFSFSVLAEPGGFWQQTGSPGGPQNDEIAFLQDYHLTGVFLKSKPFLTTVYADASHDVNEYNFFNSTISDVRTEGLTTGYREGPVPVTLSFQQSEQSFTGLSQSSTLDQTTLELHAQNERHGNTSDLTYLYGKSDRVTTADGLSFPDSSTYHYVTLDDSEHFRKSTLSSSLQFNQTEEQSNPSREITAILDYGIDHTDHLRSYYDYSFTRFDDDFSTANQHVLRAGVEHQLYESLVSSLEVHAANLQNNSTGARLDSTSFGAIGNLGYTKRLGTWGRLTMSDGISYDFTDQNTTGTEIQSLPEPHVLNAGQWVPLNQPRDLLIVTVTTDAAHGTQPLTENVDYFVDRSTDLWRIQIDPGSLIIHDGDTVLVTYDYEINPSGTFTTFGNQFQVRLDLFDQLLGFYARMNLTDSRSDTPGFVLESRTEFQAGVDVSYRNLRLNANYTDQHSTLYDYQSFALSEDYSVNLDRHSTLSLDFRQQWSVYPNNSLSSTNGTQHSDYYDFIGRYEWNPLSSLHWNIEAGYRRQTGLGVDQDLMTARTHLDWIVGKLNLRLGYEFDSQNFSGEGKERHFVYMHMRRNF